MRTWSSFLSILLYSKYLQSNFEVPGPLRSLSWGVYFTVLGRNQNIKFLWVVSTLMQWRWTEWSTRWLLLFCYNYMQMTWEWFFSSPTTNDAFSQVEVTWEIFPQIKFYSSKNMLYFLGLTCYMRNIGGKYWWYLVSVY